MYLIFQSFTGLLASQVQSNEFKPSYFFRLRSVCWSLESNTVRRLLAKQYARLVFQTILFLGEILDCWSFVKLKADCLNTLMLQFTFFLYQTIDKKKTLFLTVRSVIISESSGFETLFLLKHGADACRCFVLLKEFWKVFHFRLLCMSVLKSALVRM